MRWCLALNSHLYLHEYTSLICSIVKSIPALTSFPLLKSKAWPIIQRHKKKFIPSGSSFFFTLNLFWYDGLSKELLRPVSVHKMLLSFALWDFPSKVNNNLATCSNSMHIFFWEGKISVKSETNSQGTKRSQSSFSPLSGAAGTWVGWLPPPREKKARQDKGPGKQSLFCSHREDSIERSYSLVSLWSYPKREPSSFLSLLSYWKCGGRVGKSWE